MGTETASSQPGVDTSQVSNQLAYLVPTFDPAVDSVEIWSSKVELLLHTWPSNKISELATRLILGCKGTAYQKLQLHRFRVPCQRGKRDPKDSGTGGGDLGTSSPGKEIPVGGTSSVQELPKG